MGGVWTGTTTRPTNGRRRLPNNARHNLAAFTRKARLGVPLDYAKAIEWYERAANQDYSIAQFYLAVIYSLGQGTKPDLVKTHIWYAITADRGIGGAAENRDWVAV